MPIGISFFLLKFAERESVMKPILIIVFVLVLFSCKKETDDPKPPDLTAPTITIKGKSPIIVSKGGSYVDEGATALDDVDGDITSSIMVTNPVDVNTVGTYEVKYNVSDAAGNAAEEKKRIVYVKIT